MFEEGPDFVAGNRAGEPLHVVLHEHLHDIAVDRARALNCQIHATSNRHVRAKENWMNRRIGGSANRRMPRFSVSAFLRFVSLHYLMLKTAGRQSAFFRLRVPAYSKSLYSGVSSTPGPFMFSRRLKSSLSSRKWTSPWPSMLKSVPSASKSSV